MDRLPDIQRAAAPKQRADPSERQPREKVRARNRSDVQRPESEPAAERADSKSRAEHTDARSANHPRRFGVDDAPAAQDPAATGTAQPETQPRTAAAQDVADLIAQQPILRAKSTQLAPDDLVKASSKEPSSEEVPVALAAPLVIVPASEAPVAESRPLDLHAAPHAATTTAAQAVPGTRAPERTVEAPRETRDDQPARDLDRAADILRQVRVHLVPRTSEAHIQLEPRELGRVTIHLTVDEGHMRASVRAEKHAALDAIQAHLPELRATLRDSGIVTQEFQFSLGLENQPRRDQHRPGRPPPGRMPAIEARGSEHSMLLRATAAASGVDLYA